MKQFFLHSTAVARIVQAMHSYLVILFTELKLHDYTIKTTIVYILWITMTNNKPKKQLSKIEQKAQKNGF